MRSTAYFSIIVVFVASILILGKTLIIPFVFALLLWFIVREVRILLDEVNVIRKFLPAWIKIFIASVLIFSLLGIALTLVISSIESLIKLYPSYKSNLSKLNLDEFIASIETTLNIDIKETLITYSEGLNFGSLFTTIFNSLTDVLSNAFMVVLYTLFIFLEEAFFEQKIKMIFSKQDQYAKVVSILDRVETSIAKYLGLKTAISLMTGCLSYIILLFVGIDAPIFWASLIFILNFIPTIGSLIATLFPAAFCLLQFGEFQHAVIVLVLVGAVQVIVGNIIEPKLMGNSMNVSSLVAIISLTVWGAIWGIIGMVLSVPITVIMIIMMSQFSSTRPIAIMLSEKGTIDQDGFDRNS